MNVDEYRLGLSFLSREDLEEACIQSAKQRDALLQRSGYWMRRCELAEKQIYESLKREGETCSKNPT